MREFIGGRIKQLDQAITHRLALIVELRKILQLNRGDLRESVTRELDWEIARMERETDRDIDCMVDLKRQLDAGLRACPDAGSQALQI